MTQIYTRPTNCLQESPFLFNQTRSFCPSSHQLSPRKDWERSLKSWGPSLFRSSMSAYRRVIFEVTSPKVGEKLQAHQEVCQQRESLPPLSSLFGSPAQSSVPGSAGPHSPLSSGFVAHPPDFRNSSVSFDQERPLSSLHVQRRSPRPLSFDSSRRTNAERPGLPPPPPPPPPPPSTSAQTPKSPRYDSRQGLTDTQRYQTPRTGERYSPRSSQLNQPEFLGRVAPASPGTQVEHVPSSKKHRPELEKPRYSKASYPRASQNSRILPSYPLTPNVYGDITVTKDGLGPKIWTGTHFLPRFVHQAEVPGEGTCYFYDDGTHCKTVIDGEIVNAHWGVTKAGKPRKRLAIACITCREKKIKCDPDYPRCLQCEKFGRICKFKNAPRGGHSSPGTPPADAEESISRPGSSRDEGSTREKRENTESVSPCHTVRHKTPDSEVHHAKRQRIAFNDHSPIREFASPQTLARAAPSPSTPFVNALSPHSADASNFPLWITNPYISQPEIVTELVSIFFKQVPEVARCIFLEGPFKKWALTIAEKSQDEYTTLYAILCVASVFSSRPEQKALGGYYATICRRGCENRSFSLQLVQSRLLLAIYYLAKNQLEMAWDLSGSALRAAVALKLNLEMEKSNDAIHKTFLYGLSHAGYAECRRRTFWSAYLVDNLHGVCSGYLSTFNPENVFLRLPCDSSSFESQAEVHNPFFDHVKTPRQNSNWTIGCMGYLINIATLWGDVLTNIYRRSHRAHSASSASFTKFYEGATCRMREWNASLPRCYSVSAENIQRAAKYGKLGMLITMHSLYHNTGMKLNRYVPHSTLTKSQVAHHVAAANQHAEALLKVIDAMDVVCHSPKMPKSVDDCPNHKFSSPFVGYCIVSAVDILSAKLPVDSIAKRLASFRSSQILLSELSFFWQSLIDQQAAVQQRTLELAKLISSQDGGASRPLASQSADGSFKISEPIEPIFSQQDDCVYI